ncbi:MAG TPA: ADP-ribosyltransferase, partial [Ktedonobacteraceae bacterium]|nr:ADP-ribosyltransferase [Ktedonobacteraceae bacterium]
AHWAGKLFDAVNWCINQVNSVIYHAVDWVFGISDISNDAAILSDPNATPEEKAMAGTMMGVTALLDVAMLIPGADIFAAGGKLAGKGAMALLEKLGLDEMAKMLASKIADSVAASIVKDVVSGTLDTAGKGITKMVEYLADKGLINSLTKDQILMTAGHLLGPDAAQIFEHLSPEGQQFVANYAQLVHGMTNFEDPALRGLTADQRAAFFKAQQQAWFSQLTDAEKAAIKAYTGDDWYKAINTYARTGQVLPGFSETELQQFIQHLDPAFKNAIIPADTVAQRVVGPNMLDLFKEGKFFQDGGFVSTSIDPQHSWSNSIRLFIDLPEGAPGAFVKDLSVYPNEFEVLLPRNSVMQVERVIDLQKLALPAADQSLLSKFPEYIIELKYVGIAK